jgi:hypothetical protein
VPPSRFPFPILLADPLDSPLLGLPRVGVKGAVCFLGPVPAEGACPTALGAPGRQPCGEGLE